MNLTNKQNQEKSTTALKTFKNKRKKCIIGLYRTVMFLNLVFGVIVHYWFEENIRFFFHLMCTLNYYIPRTFSKNAGIKESIGSPRKRETLDGHTQSGKRVLVCTGIRAF